MVLMKKILHSMGIFSQSRTTIDVVLQINKNNISVHFGPVQSNSVHLFHFCPILSFQSISVCTVHVCLTRSLQSTTDIRSTSVHLVHFDIHRSNLVSLVFSVYFGPFDLFKNIFHSHLRIIHPSSLRFRPKLFAFGREYFN